MDTPIYPPANGPELAAQRQAAGVSQEAIARRIGTTRQALTRWESGKVRVSYVQGQKYLNALHAIVAEETRPEAIA